MRARDSFFVKLSDLDNLFWIIICFFGEKALSLCLEFSVNDRYVHIKNISPPSLNDAAAHAGDGIS